MSQPPDDLASPSGDARTTVRDLARAGRHADALDIVWPAYEAAPEDIETKAQLAFLLREQPGAASPDRKALLHRLLRDADVDPAEVAPAGWVLLQKEGALFAGDDPEAATHRLECDDFARDLLKETFVAEADVERQLSRVRRWLLLSGRAAEFPLTVEALLAQAAHNGGAWPFDAEERARLEESALARAYLPPREDLHSGAGFGDPVTQSVARQYEQWPYPVWTRRTRKTPSRRGYEGVPEAAIPDDADVLVAGCGTGREVALLAQRLPGRRITAIDISRASLAYAARRCAGLGGITFALLDLHRVRELGRSFDAVFTSGVLHHLPDPEAGIAALADVLKPGGFMRVMVYSKLARMNVRAARALLGELADRPVDDDLLRAVRARLIAAARNPVARSPDFYTLGGVHDLLLHRHEDPFDVSRIRRAVEGLELEFLGFGFNTPAHEAAYRKAYPDDPHLRDYAGWAAFEKRNPFIFGRMYRFWCRKPA